MTHSQTSFVRKHNYRRDIDGLRGLAVALVLAFHAFPSLVHGGFIGVDIFFVISGYLISSILLEELAHDSFTFSSFWGRRIRRIFPALILVLIANLGFGFFALFPFEFKQLGLNALAGASFASNFVSITQASYFDTAADTKPLLHLWSLAIEEQFYIFWPVLLWLSFKVRLNLLVVILFVLGTSFLLNLHEINVSRIVDFYSPQTRVWELLAGALVARFSVNKNHFVRQAIVNFPNLSALLGFTLIIFGVFFLNGH